MLSSVGVFRRKLLKEGVKMLGFMIALFVGAFIGVCVMCLCNAAAKADEQMEDHINDKNKKYFSCENGTVESFVP